MDSSNKAFADITTEAWYGYGVTTDYYDTVISLKESESYTLI